MPPKKACAVNPSNKHTKLGSARTWKVESSTSSSSPSSVVVAERKPFLASDTSRNCAQPATRGGGG